MSNEITDQAAHAAQRAANSTWLERTARVGYAVSGLLHLLIAYLALQVAWTGAKARADQSGALEMVADHSWGKVVLWIGVVGFVGLALWQLAEAAIGSPGREAKDQAGARGKSFAKGVVYLALAFTTASYARGSGTASSKQSKDFTKELLQHTGGRALVVVIGLVVVGVGAYHVYKGVNRTFLDDLREHPGKPVEYLALVGYAAKGVALAVVGVLFCVAGLRKQPSEATGLDGALKTLREQPFGTGLLTAVALGIAAYGLYSLARARYARL
ncbi:DUF1206 domain-containing protein [Angustibacter peucedani]